MVNLQVPCRLVGIKAPTGVGGTPLVSEPDAHDQEGNPASFLRGWYPSTKEAEARIRLVLGGG